MDKPKTAEEIADHYTAMGHSVNLINGSKPDYKTDEEWTETVNRNKEHLRIMVAQDYWTDEDMTDVNKAIGD
tara:strand:- start:151 stop:366 length:216 start_codon:yes stop_codon:yes gene_type:complete